MIGVYVALQLLGGASPIGSAAYTLTADAAAYSLTGVSVGLRADRKLSATSRSYALTGVNANFLRTYALDAETGAYILAGQDAVLDYSGALLWTPATPAVSSWVQASPNTITWTPVTPAGGTWTKQ